MFLGLAVVVAFLVGLVITQLFAPEDGPPQAASLASPATSPAAISSPTPLDERIEPEAQAPLPDGKLAGFADGEPVDLARYRGRPVIVNFWASWCAPCVEEMPDFQAFAATHASQVAVLGVNVRDAPSNAQAFVTELGITYDLAIDPEGAFFAEVQAFAMPTTLFVDSDATIVYRHAGFLDGEQLADLAATHLGVEG